MWRIMIVADDYGLDVSINRGIERAFRKGALTAASLLVNGPAYYDAVERALQNPSWNIGLHLNLTEGKAVLPQKEIPSLVNEDGIFKRKIKSFLLALILRKINIEDVEKEIRAQFTAYKGTCLSLTHVSGHQHIHIIPSVLRIVIPLARKYNVPYIRYPREPLRLENIYNILHWNRTVEQIMLSSICLCSKKLLSINGYDIRRKFVGFFYGGRLTKERLFKIITTYKNIPIEIMCHPGDKIALDKLGKEHFYFNNYLWEEECKALCDADILAEVRKQNEKIF